MPSSLAQQRASESQRLCRLHWPNKGHCPLHLSPSLLLGFQKIQKGSSGAGGHGAGAGNSTCDTMLLLLSRLSCVGLCATLWTAAYWAPLYMGFSRKEYQSELPPPGDLSNPGIKPGSPALQADSLPRSYQRSPRDEIA